MKQTAWLVQRAVLALLLMVSFYALALGLAGALLWIPYEAFVLRRALADQARAGLRRLRRERSSGRSCRASTGSSPPGPR